MLAGLYYTIHAGSELLHYNAILSRGMLIGVDSMSLHGF